MHSRAGLFGEKPQLFDICFFDPLTDKPRQSASVHTISAPAGPVSIPGRSSASQARSTLGEKSLNYFSVFQKMAGHV
jgi:hypothetical protein